MIKILKRKYKIINRNNIIKKYEKKKKKTREYKIIEFFLVN